LPRRRRDAATGHRNRRPRMKAYRLEDPTQTIAADTLASRGILSWTVPPNESDRTAMIDRALIERIKREHGYVDEDFVELAPETPNLDTICAKFDNIRCMRSEER